MNPVNLNEKAGKELLEQFGVDTPQSFVALNAQDAAKRTAALRAPYVVKVVSGDILHKSEAGGVTLGLETTEQVVAAIERMSRLPAISEARIDGWLVEEMVPSGLEIAIGGFYDTQFGPIIMLGLGGIYIELLKDVTFRVCPITEADARSMVADLQTSKLFDGFRGGAVYDKEMLVQALMKIGGESALFMTHQENIEELDINPLIHTGDRLVAVDARFISRRTDRPALPHAERRNDEEVLEHFQPLFYPKTVAVLGASAKEVTIANTFIRRLREFGFEGEIYPIHPKAETVEGLKAYPSLADAPKDVDYTYVAIGAGRIISSLDVAPGKCRFVQIISSGFDETDDGKRQQARLLETARGAGIRLLGPNCLGTYSPAGRLTFPKDAPLETGSIGVVSQSGGLSTDIIKRGQWRGLRFSGLATIGNSIDVKPVELLQYYLADPSTKAIGMYIEDVKNGRELFDVLRATANPKPVVILRGGATQQGQLAAQSHTGALASGQEAWEALAKQTFVELVDTVDEFINLLLALQFLELRITTPTKNVVLFGNGGGSSVLGADAFARSDLSVMPFRPEVLSELEALGFPPGTSVLNPIDTPVRSLQEKDGFIAKEILDIVYEKAKPDAIAMHLNLAAFVGRGTSNPLTNLISVITEVRAERGADIHFLLALRSDRSEALDAMRREYIDIARQSGIAVYDEVIDMARVLRAVSNLEERVIAHHDRGGRSGHEALESSRAAVLA
ncbi:hypothetical protein CR155_03610 [Pollutimonas nitritireducens]|uniref:ATP-grasp domain-containing protein n=1 Tax=Pollutimonas nitritireducens TaxID=2045209 RepID=A0A2N4UJV2_9BURK|nr:acetate--CoA ligase family protein [Pollutimonas nitritireducens]PLC55301.1 hypothetical protein CR155_03610 [Pollutimonas nitritireducens]